MKTKTTLTLRMLVKTGFLFVTLLIFLQHSVAENFGILEPSGGVIETGFDNRSLAMGKTITITSRSGSAIFSNPAILATFSKSEVQVGGKLLYGIITNEAALEDDSYESYEGKFLPVPNRSYLTLAIPYRLPHRHLPRPRDWQLVFAVGYQRNEGAKGEIQAVWSEERAETLKGERVSIHGRRRGALSTITPGVALNVQDRLFCGVTFSRTLGAITYTNALEFSDHHTKVDEVQEQSAQFLRIGALAKVTPEFSVGLMYRPEFSWEFGATITERYENGELERDRDQTQTELIIPAMWGFGAEYKVSPDLIVAFELQSRPFSELQWSGGVNQRRFIDDGRNFSVGVEYLGAGFPLRFGAFYDVIPFVDENDTTPVSLAGLTAGIGSNGDSKSFSWNASALYGTWEQVNAEGQKYSENLIRANISATYRFNTVLGSSATNPAIP